MSAIVAEECALLIAEVLVLVSAYDLSRREVRRAAEVAALDIQHRTGRLPRRLTPRVLLAVREAIATIAKEKG